MISGILATCALLFGVVDLSGDWLVAGTNFSGHAYLPGTLADAQLGKRWTERDFQTTMDLPQSEALVQEWQYAGNAVWRRTIELTTEDCAWPQELFLERVMWTSAAFWDGQPVGMCDSLATPHVYALPKLTPGRHELQLEIDNGNHYGFSRQSHAYGPNMQAVWNGVLGKVELRRAHPLRAVRVFAGADGKLSVETTAEVAAVEIDGLLVASWKQVGDRVAICLGEKPVVWNEFHPQLYTLRLTAKDGFAHSVRFGFRTYGTNGRHITLNGNDIFTRGNVENANFAKDGTPWMTKAEWAAMLKTLRDEDGVNTIRFHTWCPPSAAFDAADELGIMLQPEAGIWTDKWMSEGDEIGNGKPVDDFVRRELKAIVDAYGNSPSFLSLSIGNELGNSNFRKMGEMIDELRAYDPRALYYASSARDLSGADDFLLSHKVGDDLAREKLLPRTDWDYEDIYSASKVPTIAHEIGQWPVYPIWNDLLKPFTGTMRPWNLSRHRDTAAKRNALRLQGEYHAASAKLNRLIYKEEVESFLRTPSCAGLQLLNVQDYTGQAEALVGWRDPFYGLKAGFRGLPPFSTVWGPVSYLARFPKFIWTVGETFAAKLQIRNLTDRTIPFGTEYRYAVDGTTGVLRLAEDAHPGALADVGEVRVVLTAGMTKSKHELCFGTNRWSFWVYPQEGVCTLSDGVVETADPEKMKSEVRAGKTVLYRGPSFRCGKGQFKSVYWSARWFPVDNTVTAALGTWFDKDHPALAGFVTDDFTDWQWYDLAEGGVVHSLIGLPQEYRPIGLSVNDFHFSEYAATLFEMKVGKGRLFVCGYDIGKENPPAKRLRASIAAYLAGPVADGTPVLDEAWLEREFDVSPKKEDLSDAAYDSVPAWTGSVYRTELKGFAPVTGTVRIDFHQPEDGLTSGRGILEGRVFEVPFTERKGKEVSVTLPIIREDMLDGKLELSVNLMTGRALAIDRIRVFRSK